MTEQEDPRPLPTLTEYINEHHKLISTLAILAALSAFSSNLPNKDFAPLLSCLFLLMAILVFLEIAATFPAKVMLAKKGRLYWFGEVLYLTMFLLVMFWLVSYVRMWLPVALFPILAIPLLAVFALTKIGLHKVLKRTSWFRSRSQRFREETVPTLGAMFLLALAYMAAWQHELIIRFWAEVIR